MQGRDKMWWTGFVMSALVVLSLRLTVIICVSPNVPLTGVDTNVVVVAV